MGLAIRPYFRPAGSVVTLPGGTLLFQEGRRSSSLYVVKKGTIDLFSETTGGEDVPLGSIGPGQVLGFLTCIGDEPRPTSAKVGRDLVAVAIDESELRDVLARLPPWFEAGIKAMMQYIKALRRECESQKAQVARLRKDRYADLHAAAQTAATLAGIAPGLARVCNGRKVFVVEEALTQLESLLLRPREALRKTLDLFFNAGLLRMEIEPDRKQKVVDLDVAVRRLQFFVQFVASRLSPKTKRLLRASFSYRERRQLVGLAGYAQIKRLELTATLRIPLKVVEEEYQPAVREPFDVEVIRRAEAVDLVRLEGLETEQQLVFCPVTLTQTLAAMDIVRKLSAESSEDRAPATGALFLG